jgi:hypothetical protein
MSNIPTNAEHSEYHLALDVMLYDGSEYMPYFLRYGQEGIRIPFGIKMKVMCQKMLNK